MEENFEEGERLYKLGEVAYDKGKYKESFEYFKSAAKFKPSDSIYKMFKIANIYYDSNDDMQSNEKSFKCFKTLAEEFENKVAMYELAKMYRDGIGIKQNIKQAIFWFRKLAYAYRSESDIEIMKKSMKSIAQMYLYGEAGLQKDVMEGLAWYEKLAIRFNDSEIMEKIAKIYRDRKNDFKDSRNKDSFKDVEKVFFLYLESSEKLAKRFNDSEMMEKIAEIYRYRKNDSKDNGNKDSFKDIEKAFSLYLESFQNGNKNAVHKIIEMYHNKEFLLAGITDKVMNELKRTAFNNAIKREDIYLLIEIANAYKNEDKLEEAFDLYSQAILILRNAENLPGKIVLRSDHEQTTGKINKIINFLIKIANAYKKKGKGERAVYLYNQIIETIKKAENVAEKILLSDQNLIKVNKICSCIGEIYRDGIGVKKDPKKAEKYFAESKTPYF